MTEIEWMKIFGDNLASYLEEYRMTQKELAEEIGLSEATISAYINKRKMPGIKAIINLSWALNVSVNDLIDFGDKII